MKLTKLIFIFAIIFSTQIYSQQPFQNELFAIHPRIGYLFNFHSGNFNGVNGMFSCGSFTSGFGAGPGFSLSFEKEFGGSFISLGFGYDDKSGKLNVSSSYPERDTTSGIIRNIVTENEMDATLGYFTVKADFRYSLIDNFINGPLRAFAGFGMDIPVKSTYTQNERILSPSDATFLDNGLNVRERQLASGEIAPRTGMVPGIYFGIENLLKVGKSDYFTQQISFNLGLSNIVQNVNWMINSIKFELGYRFSIAKPEPKPEEIITPTVEPDTVKVIASSKPLKDTSTIKLNNLQEIPIPVLPAKPELKVAIEKLEHQLYTGNEILATLPIVDAVFFERGSVDIPAFYIQNYDTLPDFYHGNAVEVHKWVIPRIVEILKANPRAKLTIDGTTSGPKNEPDGLNLSMQRAKAVEKIFLSLGIPNEQISTDKRIYPLYQSNQDHDKGQIENQRADLFVENAPLQKYVSLQRFKLLEGKAFFSIESKNVPQDSMVYFTSNILDKEVPVAQNSKFDFGFKRRINDIDSSYSVSAGLRYETDFTPEISDEKSINHNDTIMIDLIVENFNAVLRFDYNSSKLSEDNRGLLRDLIAVLPVGITIIVAGSADALGPEERNVVLTKERADITIAYLNKISGGKYNIEKSYEFGKFPEDTQQGRFLDRSIRIRLRR
jgi:outer membrane protein OmpA-like peptidoglycan-associated protein